MESKGEAGKAWGGLLHRLGERRAGMDRQEVERRLSYPSEGPPTVDKQDDYSHFVWAASNSCWRWHPAVRW